MDQGTRVGKPPYPIVPKHGNAIAFPGQFVPKTFPGIINSGAGFSGGDTVLTKQVMHPGVEPRDFSKTIAENNKNNFKIFMEQAIRQAAKASGHGL